MLEFGMSKRQVLTEFYIREIPLLTHVITERIRMRQFEKVSEYSMMLKIASVTAGMAPNNDGIKELFSMFQKQFRELLPDKIEDSEGTGAEKNNVIHQDSYERLRNLQRRMAEINKGKERKRTHCQTK